MIDHLNAAWEELTAEGAQFAMTDTEVRGVPMRVYTGAPPNMRFIWELATGYGNADYLVFEDERLTYAEVDARVRSLAHHLRDTHGIGSGDRVAIAMRNYPEWVISYWAIISIGAAAVGMNAWWTPAEMAYGLRDSTPKVLIVDDERLERAVQVLDEVRAEIPMPVIATRSERLELPDDAVRWDDVVRPDTAPDGLPDADIDPDDDATIFYTSGTTGFPKGAQLTHRGSIHNLMDMAFMQMVVGAAGARAEAAAGGTPAEAEQAAPTILAPTPLFHVTAMNCLMHPATALGGKLVLMYKWDPGRALELIEREGVVSFSGVPTMSRELLNHPDWDKRDTSTIKGMGGGGAPVQPDLVGSISKSLKNGSPSTGYGLTETHGIVTANSSLIYVERPDSVGRAVPCADVKLIDAGGDEVPPAPDAVGELCVKGPIVIKGYLNKPEATAEGIVDGWFRTGDVARIDDDGFIYIVDRVKDMVIRGGENVYCSEVEAAIYEHPDVAEVAVFGVPDDRLGEAVAAAIVVRPGATLDDEQLAGFLAERIAKHKIPSQIQFRDEQLPRNANGKFLKRSLRDELAG